MKKKTKGFGTKAVHLGEGQFRYSPSSTPIYQNSTFYFDSVEEAASVNAGQREGFVYTRAGNPTVRSFEKKMAALEEADDAVAFASGMAALSAVFLEHLRPGDEIISSSHIYGGSRGYFEHILSGMGCSVAFFDPSEDISRKIPSLVNRRTRLIFFESPSNPELSIIDIRLVASLARRYRLLSVIDNTFATPYLQRPVQYGIDCVVHSATKYIGGHGDAIGGAVAGSAELIGRIRKRMLVFHGACLSPFNAWLFLRGLKTLHLRMERHCATAAKIAEFLSGSKKVRRVFYPGQEQHPAHDIAAGQMDGFGGVVSFILENRNACRKFLNKLSLCRIGVSLGDTETLALNSALMFHPRLSDAACRRIGIEPALIRLSTGLEDVEDIIEDLGRSLKAV